MLPQIKGKWGLPHDLKENSKIGTKKKVVRGNIFKVNITLKGKVVTWDSMKK